MHIKINHIAIAVENLDVATNFWNNVLGLPLEERHVVDQEEVEIAFLQVGEAKIELVQPLANNGVQRFIEKRGAGIHHLCLEVEDIVATLNQLRIAQVPLINEQPRSHPNGIQYAFVHPRGTGGVLLELYQLPQESVC